MSADAKAGGGLFRFLFVESTLGTLLAVLMVLGGVMAYATMVKEADPDLGIPAAMVSTAWPGAGPMLVEREVTEVIERHIQSLDHVKSYTSGSRAGVSLISVEFRADAPLAESVQGLRTKVWEAIAELPAGAARPSVEQVSTTDMPVMTITLHGAIPHDVLAQAALDLRRALERLGPVRKVDMGGARHPVARIVVDPQALAGLGLSLSEVRAAIQRAAVDVPLGRIENDALTSAVTLRGRFSDLEQLRVLPVKTQADGGVVTLGDIARIAHDLSVPEREVWSSLDGQPPSPSILLTLYKVPGADTVGLVAAARQVLDSQPFPPGASAVVTSDQSVVVERKLNDVFVNAGQAVVAVAAVLMLLLSWRAAMVAALAVPITFLGSLMVLQAMGMTLNTMVVVGMVLALGLLVDVFILVMEGMIQATRERGLAFADAARWTVKTYALPAFAGQLTTILALMPLLFLSGASGKFIRLIPLTAIVCLLVSYAIAFLWAISASRRLLGKSGGGGGVLDGPTTAISRALERFLIARVVSGRRRAGMWVAGAGLLVAAALVLGSGLDMEMYPKEDSRHMAAGVDLPPGTPLARSREVGQTLVEALRDAPWLESVVLHLGEHSPYASQTTSDRLSRTPGPEVVGISLNLTPLESRDGRLSHTYLPELRERLRAVTATLPGAVISLSAGPGGPGGGDGASFILQGDDLGVLAAATDAVKASLAAMPGVVAVRDDTGALRQDLMAVPRREALSAHGVDLQRVADELALAMNRTTVAELPGAVGEDATPIVLSVGWAGTEGPGGPPRWIDGLAALRVPTSDGTRIPVSALLLAAPESVPPVILHQEGTRSVTVSADLAPGVPSFAFMAQARPAIDAVLATYPGVRQAVAEAAQEQARTAGDMGRMFLLALGLMLATLVLLFRSYRLALLILVTVPLSLVGTFGGFAAIGMPMSFPAMVGLVSLVGIVVNIAIVMVETITSHRREGRAIPLAAAAGAADRLRPILSTGLTTVAGLILLSTASPMWQPLCYAIIFGLISATLLSLVVVPALYCLLAPRDVQPEEASESEAVQAPVVPA